MNKYWGVVIPGLAMNKSEMPKIDGLVALQNPEIGDGVTFDFNYSLYDVAKIHLSTIQSLIETSEIEKSFWIIGMSMGGMINSILASELRSQLPKQVKFGFLVTTPNLSTNPAVPDSLLNEWTKAKPGNADDFRQILSPFFSDSFLLKKSEITTSYFKYRAFGENQQNPKSFFRQLQALRLFDGSHTFSKIVPAECLFIGGQQDYILGPKHNENLKQLCPRAKHIEVANLGHMINLERPDLFDLRREGIYE